MFARSRRGTYDTQANISHIGWRELVHEYMG